jgi:ferredoxin
MSTNFETYLNQFTEADWLTAIDELAPEIHEVDRNAVQIWFRFYPLSLNRYIAEAEDREETLQGLAMQGRFDLKEQIDASHHFLYGHRYWKTVKAAIEAEAVVFTDQQPSLVDEIKQIGMLVAEKLKVDRNLVNGIVAVGLATLNQAGLDALKFAPGDVDKPSGIMSKSPKAIVAERAKDDSQGMLGFLKTVNKKFSIIFAGTAFQGRFEIMNEQEIASASANDRSQPWQTLDERCWEGPVPVECTAASCGTCWIGVLGGQEKLTEVARRERRQVKVFGYNQPEDETPFIRLACQAKALGNATIVIPPWNAVFGKKVYHNVEELELEPVTTSAKALREAVRTAGPDSSS